MCIISSSSFCLSGSPWKRRYTGSSWNRRREGASLHHFCVDWQEPFNRTELICLPCRENLEMLENRERQDPRDRRFVCINFINTKTTAVMRWSLPPPFLFEATDQGELIIEKDHELKKWHCCSPFVAAGSSRAKWNSRRTWSSWSAGNWKQNP